MAESSGFGDRIRSLRRKKRWSQERLGQEVGVTGGAISKYELETSEPSLEIIGRLAAALDATVAELTSIVSTKPEVPPSSDSPADWQRLVKAIDDQKDAFVAAAERQRAEYNEKLDKLTNVLEKLAGNQADLAQAIAELRMDLRRRRDDDHKRAAGE
ncbi:MAG: helix-turn-helix domain-containing protein [Candidatus Xenobia bacterium]